MDESFNFGWVNGDGGSGGRGRLGWVWLDGNGLGCVWLDGSGLAWWWWQWAVWVIWWVVGFVWGGDWMLKREMKEMRDRFNYIILLGSINYFKEWYNKIEFGIMDVL